MRQSLMALLNSNGNDQAFITLLNLDTTDERTRVFKRALFLVLNYQKRLGRREDEANTTGTVLIDWELTNRTLSCPEYQRLYQDAFNHAIDNGRTFEHAINNMLFCYYYRLTTLENSSHFSEVGFEDLLKKIVTAIHYEFT